MASDPLSSSVPASGCDVWRGSHLFVHPAASVADWDDAHRLAALAKYDGYEHCHRDFGRWYDSAGRHGAIPAGASADHGSGCVDGVWLFFVQHQFEDTSWSRDEGWSFHEAALHGSSHYHLPGVLRWFTANIGVHHVHHLCSRIPFYRLPDVPRDYPELSDVGRITFFQSLRCVPRALWDEKRRRLISFREADIGRSGEHRDKSIAFPPSDY
jgi:fatty acid desaturase